MFLLKIKVKGRNKLSVNNKKKTEKQSLKHLISHGINCDSTVYMMKQHQKIQ